MATTKRSRHSVRQRLRRHRRTFAAILAGASVLVGISALREPPPGTIELVVATTNIAAGKIIGASDVAVRAWPTAFGDGADRFTESSQAIGRIATVPILAGEPIGPSRIVGPGLLSIGRDAPSDLVAAPIHLAEQAETRLVRAGDMVDVLAARGSGIADGDNVPVRDAAATVVASAVRVIVAPTPSNDDSLIGSSDSSDTASNAMLVLAVNPATAAALAGAGARSKLSVVVRGQSLIDK